MSFIKREIVLLIIIDPHNLQIALYLLNTVYRCM